MTLTAEETESETSKFDLTLAATEREGELGFKLEYSTELFEEDTIKRLLQHLATLLEDIGADADRRLSALRLLTPADENNCWVNGTRQLFVPARTQRSRTLRETGSCNA